MKDTFIKQCELYCAPSIEKFQVDISPLVEKSINSLKKDEADAEVEKEAEPKEN